MLSNKSSHFVRVAIFLGCLWIKLGLISGQQDFQFVNTNGDEDVQVVFSETTTESHYEHRLYEKEISKCGRDESKILLSLVLRSHQWNEIIDKKKDKAVNKLSNFFSIPNNAIHLENVSRKDIYEMTQSSSRRGLSRLDGGHKYLGRIQFQIGCGKTIFPSQLVHVDRIAEQMADGTISDLADLEFGLWAIWTKPVDNRVPRAKRDVDEGSGEYDEEDEYYDEDDNEAEDGEYTEEVTEIPAESSNNKHRNRHHHGEKDVEDEEEEEEEYLPNIPTEEAQPSTTTRSTTPIIYKVQPRINLSSGRSPYIPTTEPVVLTTTTDEPSLPVVHVKSEENREEGDDYDPDVYDDDYNEFLPSTELPISAPTTTTTSVKTTEKIIVPITEPVTTTTEQSTTTTTTTEQPTTTPATTTTEKTTTTTTIQVPTTIQTEPPTTTTTTLAPPTTTVPTTTPTTTTEYFEIIEPVNNPPLIKNRLPKQQLTSGKPFILKISLDIFYDSEDGTNLKLELFDKHDLPLKANSWVQFDEAKREVYGLPLEEVVSKWIYHLRATDSSGKSVTEILDLTVQQHRTHRSENHEISIGVRLLQIFRTNVDWQIRLIRGIAETLGETSTSNIVVREIRIGSMDPTSATFVYSNETLPKDRCPEDKLDHVMKRLTVPRLSDSLVPEMSVKSIHAELIGSCKKATQTITETNPSPKNYPPIPRNAVDFIHATVGQLLIYKVPLDTFYDSDDPVLKLSLLTADRTPLDPKNWLQFDSKNEEFYGIPKQGDVGQKEYLLVAEDRGGLTATDALVVSVKPQQKRDFSMQFEMSLGVPFENFNNSGSQRRFVERLSSVFNEPSTSNIYIRQIRPIFNYTLVNFYNTTLYRMHSHCPDDEIEMIRNFYTYSDGTTRDRVREQFGSEFNLLNISFIPVGSCQGFDTIHHPDIITPIHKMPSNEPAPPPAKDDYLLTFVLPAVIIISMLIFASVIACYLHRRRLTGKMELGDEEERRSFKSKGIPVIFQDELDEKPEIGNKSPVILKDEKPPLLPPSYTSTNPDDNDDVDDYVPPPAVLMGGRESRGKSPVTPSYRKPPPYVSP